MNRLPELRPHILPLLVVFSSFALYAWTFARFHAEAGVGISSLAIVPVIVAGWFFGPWGGIALTSMCILANMIVQLQAGQMVSALFSDPGASVGIFSLFVVAIATGLLSYSTRQRKEAMLKLEQYEKARHSHTKFLELLNIVTVKALEANSLKATLEILIERLGHLFQADDVFFSLWDESKEVPIPFLAFGSMKDIYPYVQFEPGDATLTTSVMKAAHPIFIANLESSPYISPKVAAIFPSCSMLGIPLMTQHHKLGAILLGFNKHHSLGEEDIFHAEITAEQISLVLSKAQLLEDERKQVRQLTALHDIAQVAIEVDNEDQLIERVTDIIGQNLFPDNFGILMLDEQAGILRVHPSYRFYMLEDLKTQDIPVGKGITGKVAETGQPRRVGNVRRVREYIDMDDRTISELSVPIKFKERILGVINAESTKRDAFTPDDERLLATLAGQLATAIEQLRTAKMERIILDQLAHDKELIYSIAQITAQIERSLQVDQIIETMGKELGRIGLTCIMAVYDEARRIFTINYTSLSPALLDVVEAGLGYPLLNYGFSRRTMDALLREDETYRPIVLQNPEAEIEALFTNIHKDGIQSILQQVGVSDGVEPLRLPLVAEENLLGMLWVWGTGVTRSDLPILSIFSKQIGMSLERARLFREVQSLALTDSLTGLQNRRSLFELGRIEFSRAQRMDRPFSCMMLDIDHFKKINDEYGHQIGDEVLQEFGTRCKAHVREIDLVGRYGGEEFMVLLPETERDLALVVAERFRRLIAENPIHTTGGILNVTVSVGVAMKDDKTTHLDALIARADQALYISKHKGRNRVSIST